MAQLRFNSGRGRGKEELVVHEECGQRTWSVVAGLRLAGCFLQQSNPGSLSGRVGAPPSSHSFLSLSVPLPLYSLGARLGEDSGLKITLDYWRA